VLYHIAVDGYDGSGGHVMLDYSFVPQPIAHIDVQTPDGGGTVTPGSGLYPMVADLVFTAAPGPHHEFDYWERVPNPTDNPVTFRAAGDMQLIAHFKKHEPTDGFESGGLISLPWETPGDVPWVVESTVVSSGNYAARSGAIRDGQSSSLILRGLVLPAGTVSFDFKVSSELNWDFLEFYLNGKRLARWSGEVNWLTFRFAVAAGPNTMEWRYVKDAASTAMGADAVYIDNLELPTDAARNGGAAAATIRVQLLADGHVRLSVHGPTAPAYSIQASTDLQQWSPLPQAQALGSGTKVLDATTTAQTRFYRLEVTLP
jgi:hypothetical protein